MARKNILEDIKPMTKSDNTEPRVAKKATKPTPVLPKEIPYVPSPQREMPKYTLWYIAGGCLIAFLLSLSFLFESATVRVTGKTVSLDFDTSDQFVATKDTNAENTISYTVMSLSGTETIKLPATETKKLNEYATGTVVLYNTYRSTSYSLVKNTRLITPEKKEYKLISAVSIPGYKKTGSGIVPGSVEARVIASLPGEVGNIDKADFSVPGLKGTAQETKIFGRTKTAISGGMTGEVYTVPQSSADLALGELTTKLKTSLISKAKVQVPDGYSFYEGATVFKVDPSVQVPYSKEKDVPIVLKGSLSAYLLKTETLKNAIISTSVTGYEGEPLLIPKLAMLSVAPKEGTTLNPLTDTTFKFNLIGHADIFWQVPISEIQKSLAGAKKVQFESLAGNISAIDKATVVIKPFWKRSFPKNPERIEIIVENPAE